LVRTDICNFEVTEIVTAGKPKIKPPTDINFGMCCDPGSSGCGVSNTNTYSKTTSFSFETTITNELSISREVSFGLELKGIFSAGGKLTDTITVGSSIKSGESSSETKTI